MGHKITDQMGRADQGRPRGEVFEELYGHFGKEGIAAMDDDTFWGRVHLEGQSRDAARLSASGLRHGRVVGVIGGIER